MGYSKLEKNLIDLMKEEQAKLGYRSGGSQIVLYR